jgi:hypothetical protein
MLYTMILIVSLTTIVLAASDLAFSLRMEQARRENAATARHTFDAAVEVLTARWVAGGLTLPYTFEDALNGWMYECTLLDNQANVPQSLRVVGSVYRHGHTYNFQRVISKREPRRIFDYVLFAHADLDGTARVETGALGAAGDIGGNGKLNIPNAANLINGDIHFTGPNTAGAVPTTGERVIGLPTIGFPTANPTTYLAASFTSIGSGSINGLNFSVGGAFHPLHYRSGNLSLRGTFSGRGTIFVAGNVTVNGDIAYANAASRLVIIVDGNVLVNEPVAALEGIWFVKGDFILETNGVAKTLGRGSIAASKIDLKNVQLTARHDPAFWLDRSEAHRHRYPGVWP